MYVCFLHGSQQPGGMERGLKRSWEGYGRVGEGSGRNLTSASKPLFEKRHRSSTPVLLEDGPETSRNNLQTNFQTNFLLSFAAQIQDDEKGGLSLRGVLSGIVSRDAAAIRIRIRIVRCQRPAKRQKHKRCETQAHLS